MSDSEVREVVKLVDPEVLDEVRKLTPAQQDLFMGCLAVCLDEGMARQPAEREAMAAVLRAHRLANPLFTEAERREALQRYAINVTSGSKPGNAERSAIAWVLRKREGTL